MKLTEVVENCMIFNKYYRLFYISTLFLDYTMETLNNLNIGRTHSFDLNLVLSFVTFFL